MTRGRGESRSYRKEAEMNFGLRGGLLRRTLVLMAAPIISAGRLFHLQYPSSSIPQGRGESRSYRN
jgi:hypothetical protein